MLKTLLHSSLLTRTVTGLAILWQGSQEQGIVYFLFFLLSHGGLKNKMLQQGPLVKQYRTMAVPGYEITRLLSLLKELDMAKMVPIKLYCDNQAAMHVMGNPVCHERTKCTEVDWHYVKRQLEGRTNCASICVYHESGCQSFLFFLFFYKQCYHRSIPCSHVQVGNC